MSSFASAFSLPFGGTGLSGGKPWVVNRCPSPDLANVHLLRPVRFSVRDAESYVLPDQIHAVVGYAKIHSNGEQLFDRLPRTKRISLGVGGIGADPAIGLVGEGVRIEKTLTAAQRGVYTTRLEAGVGYRSAMITARVRPDMETAPELPGSGPLNPSISPAPIVPLPYFTGPLFSATGVVLGLEHGPRNSAAYLWLQRDPGGTRISLSGPIQAEPSPFLSFGFDWSVMQRYTILWNEATGYVEVYQELDGATTQIFRAPISSFGEMPDDYYARAGEPGDIVGLYGMEGVGIGDASTWSNVAVTADVGYPIIGSILPGDFRTKIVGAELVKTLGAPDPRDAELSCWFDAPTSLFADRDLAGTAASLGTGFQMTKATSGKTLAVYREEPGFLRTVVEGFSVDANLSASMSRLDRAATGTGLVIYDGQTVFQLQLFDDLTRKTIGLRKKNNVNNDTGNYFLPSTSFDWSVGNKFRFVVDGARAKIQVFAFPDLTTPILDMVFDRSVLPDAADFGYVDLTPFIAFGHITPVDTLGTFTMTELVYSHIYQAWEAREGLPTAAADVFTADNAGTLAVSDGVLSVLTPALSTSLVHRSVEFGLDRGALIEARCRITANRPRSRTGTYLALDDGLHTFALSFVETDTSRFVAVAVRDGFGGFKEVVGKDGEGALLSFQMDWRNFHTYRLSVRPFDGLYVFVDEEINPRIVFANKRFSQLPDAVYGGTPTLAFGQFTEEGSRSEWQFVRSLFSSGYEISFRKNEPDSLVREELVATQASVIVDITDAD
jgi:hypothetical protein